MAEKIPQVSVVIPALNEEKYLGKCLQSFKAQVFKDFEIIVVDGGSTDKTTQIAKQAGARIVHLHKSNICQARQEGAMAAAGKFIVGADADNIYPPSHLKRIVDDFNLDPEIVAVGGIGVFEPHPLWVYWGWRIAYFIFGKIFETFKLVIYIPAFSLAYRKDVFTRIGGYRTYLDFGGDEIDILERLKKEGPVYFDTKIYSHASSRRAKLGFWQLIVKHTLIDYYLNLFLARIFKRPIIRGKPVR